MSLSTDVAIRRWKPFIDGQAQSVDGRGGLYVRGWLSGAKSFYFRSKTWVKIGDYPEVSLAQARELATVAKRLAREGYGVEAFQKGFANARTSAELEGIVKGSRLSAAVGRSVLTYNDVFHDWFEGVSGSLQEGPSRRRPQAIHDLHISPRIGSRPINDIRRREIFDLLSIMFREIPVSAGHALGHLNKVFERAINMELVDANPVPPRSAFPRNTRQKSHHGTLSPDQIPDLWQWLQKRSASKVTIYAILTAMCTAHRIGVIVNAKWHQIDETNGTWSIPERIDKSTLGRMKSGREYAVTLPSGLLERLVELRRRPDQVYVFESPATTGPITSNAILKVLKAYDPNLTSHGFRNAVKVWCRNAEPMIADHIADAFCDHSLKGLDASYRRGDTSQERKLLAERLFAYVTSER